MSGICASTTALSSSACAASTLAGSAASAATDSELRTKSRRLTSASIASDMAPPGVYECVRSATITRAGGSEGIVDAAEDRGPAVTEAEIDVTDDVGTGDTANAKPCSRVQLRDGTRTCAAKDLAGIHERSDLQAHAGAKGVEAG